MSALVLSMLCRLLLSTHWKPFGTLVESSGNKTDYYFGRFKTNHTSKGVTEVGGRKSC